MYVVGVSHLHAWGDARLDELSHKVTMGLQLKLGWMLDIQSSAFSRPIQPMPMG
jgi:hypothetical protein